MHSDPKLKKLEEEIEFSSIRRLVLKSKSDVSDFWYFSNLNSPRIPVGVLEEFPCYMRETHNRGTNLSTKSLITIMAGTCVFVSSKFKFKSVLRSVIFWQNGLQSDIVESEQLNIINDHNILASWLVVCKPNLTFGHKNRYL